MTEKRQIKNEMMQIIDRYVMNNNPRLEFTDEDRITLNELTKQLKDIKEK